jgi:hypothetical protein
MTSTVKYKQINTFLVEALPELRDRYEEELAAWGEEMGPHVVYGDLLNPYLSRLLDGPDDPSTHEPLRRVFDFLERLLAHPDPDFSDVARTTVAEDLETDRTRLQRARRFMGPLMAEETRDR